MRQLVHILSADAIRRSILCWIAVLVVVGGVRAEDSILVLKSRDAPQYAAAAAGFTREWSARGSAESLVQKTLTGTPVDESLVSGLAVKPFATLAVGTDATLWALKNTRGPVVFCMVANARHNILSSVSSNDTSRVYGVSLDVPAETQLQEMLAVLPNAKRIGVLFDPEKSSFAVDEMARATERAGLRLVAEPVIRESGLSQAAEQIGRQIDVLWAPVDSTVFNSRSAQFVLTKMLERHVPVMGFSENMVKAGALMATCVDYAASGKQAAGILSAVTHGNPTAITPLYPPERYELVVNARVQHLLGNPMGKSTAPAVRLINNADE